MARRGRPRHPDILTPREWEVLALIREGLTNDQIGERLGITERAARYHVSEILSKLGVESREAAAAWSPPGADLRAEQGWPPVLLRIALVGSAAAMLVLLIVLALGVLQTGRSDAEVTSLEGAHAYVFIVYGCECPPPPSAGFIEVRLVADTDLEIREATVVGVGWPTEFEMKMDSYPIRDTCYPDSGLAHGFVGSTRISLDSDLPALRPARGDGTGGGIDPSSVTLRLRYEAGGEAGWATVPVTEVCTAAS